MKASILLVNSKLVRGLYYLYLKIQKPISEVHIVSNKKEMELLVQNILKKNIENNSNENNSNENNSNENN